MQITYMHTFRGSFPIYWRHGAIYIGAILQILVLSSNTKKGEIERTFPEFCVLGNNTSDNLIMWLSDAGVYNV